MMRTTLIVSVVLTAFITLAYLVATRDLHSNQRQQTARYDLEMLHDAICIHKATLGQYPPSLPSLKHSLKLPRYILDPWGRSWLYANETIGTFGSDGVFGGNADHEKDVFINLDCGAA